IGTEPTEDRKGKRVAGKVKADVVVKEKEKRKRDATSVSDKDEVTKKQRTLKKRAPRASRKFVVYEEDDEETDEEPLTS
ncbi:hypothetical protein A2U01_0094949, partial [Trifolium medium]|nr:hypothetical protein [Trifolium medium]